MKMFTKKLSIGLIAVALGSTIVGAASPAMAKGGHGGGWGHRGGGWGHGWGHRGGGWGHGHGWGHRGGGWSYGYGGYIPADYYGGYYGGCYLKKYVTYYG